MFLSVSHGARKILWGPASLEGGATRTRVPPACGQPCFGTILSRSLSPRGWHPFDVCWLNPTSTNWPQLSPTNDRCRWSCARPRKSRMRCLRSRHVRRLPVQKTDKKEDEDARMRDLGHLAWKLGLLAFGVFRFTDNGLMARPPRLWSALRLLQNIACWRPLQYRASYSSSLACLCITRWSKKHSFGWLAFPRRNTLWDVWMCWCGLCGTTRIMTRVKAPLLPPSVAPSRHELSSN